MYNAYDDIETAIKDQSDYYYVFDRVKLQVIALAKDLGFKISEVSGSGLSVSQYVQLYTDCVYDDDGDLDDCNYYKIRISDHKNRHPKDYDIVIDNICDLTSDQIDSKIDVELYWLKIELQKLNK